MEIINTLALYGTIIEISLILLIVLITIVLRIIYYYSNKAEVNLKSEIESFLLKKMKTHSQIEPAKFKEEWKDLKFLLSTIAYFDKNHANNNWRQIRSNFVRNIILPLARSSSKSNDWTMRNAAALAFSLYSDNNDEEYIVKLINDEIPLVRYSAATAGIIHGSENAFEYTIRQMAKETWLTQTIYMQGFNNVPAATHHYIVRLLKETNDPAIKATCYNLLLKYPVFVSDWDVTKDIESTDIKLALSATMYFSYNHKIAAAQNLIDLLQHPNWKMRALVIACLGNLNATPAIHHIRQRLNDENWWVRFSAKQALLKIEKTDDADLATLDSKADELHVNVSEYVLNTL